MSRPAGFRADDDPKVEPFMLHTPISRASARAATMAHAHADVTARHPLVLGIALGAVLSVAITAGTASSAAAAVEAHSNAVSALTTATDADPYAPATGAAGLSIPLADIASDAQAALSAAQTSIDGAAALTAEVASSGLTIEAAATSIDTTALQAQLTDLAAVVQPGEGAPLEVVLGTVDVTTATAAVTEATAALQTALTAAQEKKAAEEAAAAAQAAANTPEGAKATARAMAASQYGWGDGEFSCLVSLWTKESGWNYQAYNPSGATGIPQALPGDKMATAGSDWQTNATTQVAWGLSYIDRAYGSPCAAWGHSQATNWY